jgi:hypothetical protein
MTKKNIQYCSLAGLGRTTTLWDQGQRRFNGIEGSGRTTALQAQGWRGSTASWAQEWHQVHSVAGSGRTMLLRAQERRRGVGDGACVVDGITGSGRGR